MSPWTNCIYKIQFNMIGKHRKLEFSHNSPWITNASIFSTACLGIFDMRGSSISHASGFLGFSASSSRMMFWLSIALVSPLMVETILSQKSSRVSFNSTPGLEADYEEDEEEWEGERTTSLPISAGGSGRAASSVGSNTNGSSVKISTKRFLSKIPNFLGLANS